MRGATFDEVVEALADVLRVHDSRTNHVKHERGAVYDRGSRRPTKGMLNVFRMVGPEGFGFYPCWCNEPRGVLNRARRGGEE